MDGEETSFESVNQLVNDLKNETSQRKLAKIIKSGWIDEHWMDATPDQLETILLVAESGIEHAKMQRICANIANSDLVSEDYVHAFRRFNAAAPDLQIVKSVHPPSPQHFANAVTMWQWHYDFMVVNGFGDAIDRWVNAFDKVHLLYRLWTPQPYQPPPKEAESWLVLLPETETTEFLNLYEGKYTRFEEVVADLKRRATTKDPVFGRSLAAASVGFADNTELVKLCRRLDPYDVLGACELNRYMIDHGADIVAVPPKQALNFVISRHFEGIAFPTSAFADPIKRTDILLVLASVHVLPASGISIMQDPLPFLPQTQLTAIQSINDLKPL